MKRRVSMLLIMLANIFILAHAVVPHHHHNKVFVAIVNVLGEDQHHDSTSHHHDGDSEDCLMSEAEAAVALKIQTDENGGQTFAPLLDSSDGGLVLLAVIAIYEMSFNSPFGENSVKQQPYVTSGHTDFVARSKGLRAPPTC